jgi:hypothetical protein
VKWLVLACMVAACKERGTIAVELAGDPCTIPNTTVVVYAEPNLSCDLCDCGACFGAKPDGVILHDGVCRDGIELDLHPGHWAIVVAVLDAGSKLVRQGCVDVDVDADGTGSSTVEGTVVDVAATCPSLTGTMSRP